MAKSSSSSVFLAIAAVVTLATVLLPSAVTAITCNQVNSGVNQCVGYFISGGTPSQVCCQGITSLNNEAVDTASRRAVCNCLKSYASRANGNQVIIARAQALPGLCNLNLPYPISSSVDCNSLK